MFEEVFDSRDIEDRIRELEADIEYMKDHDEDISEQEEELNFLLNLRDEIDSSEWEYGITFIEDDYFTDYAEQMAYDIGAVDVNNDWPNMHIDWEAAADALKIDYEEVRFNGKTYYYLAS